MTRIASFESETVPNAELSVWRLHPPVGEAPLLRYDSKIGCSVMVIRCASSLLLALTILAMGCARRPAGAELPSPVEGSRAAREQRVLPRLVVWFTVDQMRGDYLDKYAAHFKGGGFGWFLNRGRFFSNAHYGHAITETAPGHATLFTGASPREHGIVANEWLLPDGSEIVSVADGGVRLVGASTEGEEGRSPRQLLLPTIGDAMKEQTGNRSRVVSVSVKDRGAILPGGQMGLALWLGPSGFVTSSYYAEETPPWLGAHALAHPIESYLGDGWNLSAPTERYMSPLGASPYALEEWGPSFPHELSEGASPKRALENSPFGDVAVLDLALSSISGEGLGADDVVDLLAISLSSTDKVGHQYGPESREFEDQLMRLDAALGAFLSKITAQIPSEQLVFVLSSDHGGCESAEYLRAAGRKGIRLTEGSLEQAALDGLRGANYSEAFLLRVLSPYVYLDQDLVREKGADLSEVRRAVAASVSRVEGVHLVWDVSAPASEGELGERVQEALHPGRSGDLYVVPERDALFLQAESLAATHGSPWDYDTHVPIVLVGPGVESGRSSEPVDVRSLVPTVARLIGITPPRGARAAALPITDPAREGTSERRQPRRSD